MSGRDATAGLKAALDKGAVAAVASLGRTDGFWANPKVRIPLPEQLQRVRSALRFMGKGDEVDALELAVNRAAEQAVPQAKTLLTNAVKSMSVDDAKQILRGGDDSVTQFFKSKTAPQLAERFLPIVRRVTERSGLAQQYNALAGQGACIRVDQARAGNDRALRHAKGARRAVHDDRRRGKENPSESAGSRQRHHSQSVRSAQLAMNYWLMKSEPDECSIDDALAAPRATVPWTGVRGYQARNFMRDRMKLGDGVFFYHSSCDEPGIVGLAEVASEPYPDPTQFDRKSKYYDAASKRDAPRWMLVDIKALQKTRLVPLAELREQPTLADMVVLRRGNRLSITPVTADEWRYITTRLLKT